MKVILDNGAYMPERGHDESYNNCKCPICGKAFHCKPYHLKKYKTHYCSKECQNEARKDYMRGSGNHQYGLRGSKNSSWKSDKKISRYGYIQIRVSDHPFADKEGFVLEHRLVAEKYLLTEENSVCVDGKMYLSPNYIVHHKDKNKTNNNPENLEVMKKSDHQKIHSTEDSPLRKRDEKGRYSKGQIKDLRAVI